MDYVIGIFQDKTFIYNAFILDKLETTMKKLKYDEYRKP